MTTADQTAPDALAGLSPARAWRLALGLAVVLTLVRLLVLFGTPLELYPDEAQYWLWSRVLDWGYFSKPPMIAWLIAATTAIGGDAEPWVRLSAPLLQGAAGLTVFAVGLRLYGAAAGLAASALYALMPGVQLASAVIATDAPLLMFLGLGLWAYTAMRQAPTPRAGLIAAAALGATLGLALLSKYAAVYALIGLGLHAAVSAEARRVWSGGRIAVFASALAVCLAPNMIWNLGHGFATVTHTAANADWGVERLFNLAELWEFTLGQFGVFGPIPLVVLVGGAVWAARKGRLQANDVMLLCFIVPPLLVVSGQAFLSRANANWAASAYVAGAVLTGALFVRWRAWRWLVAALGTQAVLAAAFTAATLSPEAATRLGLDNSFKRARGWSQTAEALMERVQTEQAKAAAAGRAPVSAVAVDDRFLFNAVAYYARRELARPGAPPLTMWVRMAQPLSQAEASSPLTPALGSRVVAASLEGGYLPEMRGDFVSVKDEAVARVRLDPRRVRRTVLVLAEGFEPAPRDPSTGAPPAP